VELRGGISIMVFGYTRASTLQQSTLRGEEEIRKFCKQEGYELIDVFTDNSTGRNFDRTEYQFLRKRLQKQDILVIPELDRLGRNREGVLEELRYFKEKGVRVMILEIPLTLRKVDEDDNSDAALINNLVTELIIQLYSTFSELETRKRAERQRQSIELMKQDPEEWKRYGRPALILPPDFIEVYKQVQQGKIKPFEAIKKLGMKKSTFYKYKTVYEQGKLA
jgi:DNA invertase Pin-like site-specific DNA recombinase